MTAYCRKGKSCIDLAVEQYNQSLSRTTVHRAKHVKAVELPSRETLSCGTWIVRTQALMESGTSIYGERRVHEAQAAVKIRKIESDFENFMVSGVSLAYSGFKT